MKNNGKMRFSEFIEDNQHVINVFGIFAAVTAYFGQIDNGGAFCDLLYLIFLSLTVVLGIEVIDHLLNCAEEKIGIKQNIFGTLFFAGVATISTYAVFEAIKRGKSFLILGIWLLATAAIIFLLDKLGLYKNFYKDRDRTKTVKFLFLILISALMYYFSQKLLKFLP